MFTRLAPCPAALAVVLAVLFTPAAGVGQVAPGPSSGSAVQKLSFTVTDENGVAVPAARVFLQPPAPATPLKCGTDFAGHCQLNYLPTGSYQLRVEKEGFYALTVPEVQVGATSSVDVTILHLQEVREVVNVVESPPAIDPAQTASEEKLSGLDIINIPYPTTRDYRNALNFMPGVVQDVFGQPHIAGAQTYQTLTLLDGFNVTQPATGQLLVRVSTDALRSVGVETSRYPAEEGKGAGGVLSLNTGIGDDHYRFAATNFIPSIQDKKGLTLDKIDPRFTLSGPLRKGKVWFFDAADGEYDNVVITELPDGADHDTIWRVGNLAKAQTNLSPRNILTASFLLNRLHDEHLGLSVFNPVEATPSDDESAWAGSIKDQHYFAGGELLETGVGFSQYGLEEKPLGTAPYFISSEKAGGNFYFAARTRARRWQALANLYVRPRQWHGRHEWKLGLDLDRLVYAANFERQPISFLREGNKLPPTGTCLTQNPSPCSRYSVFSGGGNSSTYNLESSGYIQDRWLVTDRLLVEPGLRFDWDEIVRRPLLSPRLAATYVLDKEGNTKLSAGIGIVYDPTNLVLVARPSAGQRLDHFFVFDANGDQTAVQVLTTFSADTHTLQKPRFLNWSIGLEQKLPWDLYLKAEFLEKRGTHGFVYNTANGVPGGNFVLQNTREDRYDAFQLNLRRTFRHTYVVFGSYTRSRSRSNQVLDFNVDSPILSPQAAGPYPWDAPNRFLSWGLLPLIKGFDLAYSMEWRDGFPFSVVNDQQQLVGPPGSRRFPMFFTLNLSVEKRFRLFGFYWAVRGGFDDITGRKNPALVDNDIQSPTFLTFFGLDRRAFTTRIRFLGRK